jgi:hypothetical protein
MVCLTGAKAVRVFPRALPVGLDRQNNWLSVPQDGFFEFIETTSLGACSQEAYGQNTQALDLQGLHEQSGLTWKQLAILFFVDVRMIHYWLSGERGLSSEHAALLIQLVRLLSILNLGATYKTRKFLEENLLNNHTLLLLIKNRDFATLEHWARGISHESLPQKLAISPNFLSERAPSRLVFKSEGLNQELEVPSGKSRLAKIRRRRRGSGKK